MVLAADNSTITSEQSLQLQKKVNTLSDKEFDDFLVNYVSEGRKNGKDISTIENEIKNIGVDLNIQNVSDDNSYVSTQNIISPYGIGNLGMRTPDEYYVMIAHRGQDKYYRVYAYIDLFQGSTAATQDCISIEWDYDDATYYSTSVGSGMTLRDGTNRFNGMYLFNYDDWSNYNLTYAAVYVTPTRATSDFNFASKIEHTWDYDTVKWTENLNISATTTGAATLGYTFTRTGSTTGYSQPFFTDNTATIQVY